MFKPVSFFIGLRYTRARRRNHFISFISCSALLGIALGMAVLITVLSVMNGFDKVIHTHFFSLAQQVSIRGINGRLENFQSLEKMMAHEPEVLAIAPFVEGQGLLNAHGQSMAVLAYGILPEAHENVSDLSRLLIAGTLNKLQPGHFGLMIGSKLAANMGVGVGDKVTLVVPTASLTPAGIFPRFKVFTVEGIFKAGNGFGYDSGFVYMHLSDAKKLFLLGNAVSGMQLKLKHFYAASPFAQALAKKLPEDVMVSDWTRDYGMMFEALKLEKSMMFFILMLIVAVAVFNLVSMLVMTVTDKQADIAILKTLGASSGLIVRIFIVQGMIIGTMGTLLGVIGGVVLSFHATAWADFLLHFFHVQWLNSDVYWVDYLPSELWVSDIIKVVMAGLGLCFIATIYPAWQAAKTRPAQALRYE